ncbi:MAG: RDD family protein [Candidatus Limnocylindrales bacterium]
MGGWAVPANASPDPMVAVPAGTRLATMGYRIGAWFLDNILVGLLGIIPFIGVIVTGAVGLNQRALDQVDTSSAFPFDGVTAPFLNWNPGLLAVWAALYVAIRVAYFAGSWVRSGATPCQRSLKIRVVDSSSSRNLTMSQALLRWFFLDGVGIIVSLILAFYLVDWVAKVPTNDWLASRYSYSRGLSSAFGAEYYLLSWATTIWSVVLLITAARNGARRGFHDRLARSVVLSPQTVASWPGYPPPGAYWPAPGGYLPQPGTYYPPPGAYWPAPGGYPPQPGTYYPPPGTWPPPQPGAWPPQPGYPPPGMTPWPPVQMPYAGYPGYPGVPQGSAQVPSVDAAAEPPATPPASGLEQPPGSPEEAPPERP